MHDTERVKLDRIAASLDMPVSEVRSWIEKLCREPAVEIQMSGPDADGVTGVHRPEVSALKYDEVVRVVEAVVVGGVAGEPNSSLSEIHEKAALSEFDLKAVCAKSLARKFHLKPGNVARLIETIEFSSKCVFVGAPRRDSDGCLVFGSGAEKRQAKALLKALVSAAEDIRGRLQPFIDDRDPTSGLPAVDLRISSSAWLREVPREVYEPLLQWASDGGLCQFLSDVENAKAGPHDEHRRNVAMLVHEIFRLSGQDRKTRHDGQSTPFMVFAETVGHLFDLKMNHRVLEETRDQRHLFGMPRVRVTNHRS